MELGDNPDMNGMLLILLIARGPLPPQLAFVAADDAVDCRSREAMLIPLIASTGGRILARRCVASSQRYTPYRHAPPVSAPASVWRVDLTENPPVLERQKDWASCRTRVAATPGDDLCALSRQQPEGQWGRWWRRLRGLFY